MLDAAFVRFRAEALEQHAGLKLLTSFSYQEMCGERERRSHVLPIPNNTQQHNRPCLALSSNGGTYGVRWNRLSIVPCDKPAEDTMREASRLEQLLLLVGLDRAVGSGVGHARQRKALGHLVVVEERAVRLVNGALGDLARARRARARAARVGQVDAILLSLVQNVDVGRAVNLLAGMLG